MVDTSYLLGLFGGSSTAFSTGAGFGAAPVRKRSQPTAPWAIGQTPPEPSALVRSALSGRRLIDESTPKLDLAGASGDYRKLFALYQGLQSLNALAERADTRGLSDSERALITKRFDAGLNEVGGYIATSGPETVRLVQGTASATLKTTAAVPRSDARYLTAAIHSGSISSEVAAFAGDVRFDITVRGPTEAPGDARRIAIDLSDLGTTPRTLDAVITHINGVLSAAGVETRVGREQVNTEPRTVTVNGKAIPLPAGPDQYALVVRGTSNETIGFQAAQTSDAVYVVQSSGSAGLHQLLKFQGDDGQAPATTGPRPGETNYVDGRLSQTGLPKGISTVRASATAPDGSLWVVADISVGPDTQPIKGRGDVALLKYDPAGNLVAQRALGAADTASGFALAIDANGRVAVAGSVTGALNTTKTDAGKTGDKADLADSFVTVFGADGVEQWTGRRGARLADEATSVRFADDGTVVVAGRAQSAIPGTVARGQYDGYIQTFRADIPFVGATPRVTVSGATQFGTVGNDSVDALTIDGNDLYTAGVENGRAILRRFTLDSSGVPTPVSSRDLGAINGEIAGLSVSGGRIIVAGSAEGGNLSALTVTKAHSGGSDAFVAVVSTDLADTGQDGVSFHGGAGNDTAADVKIVGDQVWLTGTNDRAIGSRADDPAQAYLARIDALSGAETFRRVWDGVDAKARPLALAVASGGASVLDRLGLPAGEIDQSQSRLLTSATSLRVGDRFYITAAEGGRAVAVTITADDTLQSLSRRIEQASLGRLKVTLTSEGATARAGSETFSTAPGGLQRLSITAKDDRGGAILTRGETGRDALAGLGLAPGFIGVAKGADVEVKTFGLDLPSSLSLANAEDRKAALERLFGALKAVRDSYRSLAPASTASRFNGPVPAYLSNQIANYQAALDRLGG